MSTLRMARQDNASLTAGDTAESRHEPGLTLAGIVAGVVGGVGFVAWSWAQHGFANIAYLKFTLFLLYTATVVGSFGMSLFYAHLLKRT